MNKVHLIGHTGKDPEVRTLDNNNTVASFSFATVERFNKNGEKKEVTTWHNIVAWGKLAEIIEKYVKKGSHLALVGKISNRSYDDKQGIKKYISEVIVDEMEMLGSKTEQTGQTAPAQSEPAPPENESGNDIPFSFILPIAGLSLVKMAMLFA